MGSFHWENGTTFSEIPFIPENFQWNEPKSRVPFTTLPEIPEFFGKWKTLSVSLWMNTIASYAQFKPIRIRENLMVNYNGLSPRRGLQEVEGVGRGQVVIKERGIHSMKQRF